MCHHFGLLFGKRLDTVLLRHRIRKYPDSPVHTLSDSLRFYIFSSLVNRFKISGYAVEFAGCMQTVAVSGKEKLRIQKYADTLSNSPDACGW